MSKFVMFLKSLLSSADNEIYYLGGSDVLPPPLKGQQEMDALEAGYHKTLMKDPETGKIIKKKEKAAEEEVSVALDEMTEKPRDEEQDGKGEKA